MMMTTSQQLSVTRGYSMLQNAYLRNFMKIILNGRKHDVQICVRPCSWWM